MDNRIYSQVQVDRQSGQQLCVYCQRLKDWEWTIASFDDDSAFKRSIMSHPTFLLPQEHRHSRLLVDNRIAYIEHQLSFTNLFKSAAQGCRLCALFLRQALKTPDLALPGRGEHHEDILKRFQLIRVSQRLPNDATGPENSGEGSIVCSGFVLYYDTFASTPFFQLQFADEGPPARTLSRLQGPRADLDLAFEWLLDCKTNHASCRNAARYPPPSRLLHVRSNSEDSEPMVRLVETEMFNAPFAALSHRWGTRQPLRTTQSNYEKHLKEIPFDDLPKTFQDATLLVKRFGIKYLWIDSLCIIQDSVLDWESECPRMAGVYSNALFTIAAANASDSSKGFLGDFESSTRCDLGDGFMIRHIPNDTEWSLLDELLLDDEPCLLSNRGWVLQERLLSQRVLSFKAGRLQWQCNTHYRSDDILRPYQPAVGFSGATKKAIAHHEDRASGYSYWQRIIENYSGCYLTHPQDKLPALSSLAFEFIKNEKDDYLAGLWKGDMPFSLCWKAQPEPKDKGQELPQSSISDYRAPSWSWASCNHRVSYDHLRRNSWNLDLEILYGDTVLHGLNQFGRVDGGELVAYARIATIQVVGYTLKTNKSGASTPIGDLEFDSPELALEHLQMDMRITVLLVVSCDYTLERGLLREISIKKHHTVNVSRMWRGLIVDNVENEEGEDVYRRIGLVDSMDCLREAWFDCERRVVKLI